MSNTPPNDLQVLSRQSKELPLYRLRVTQTQYTALKDYLISIQNKHQHDLSTLCRNRHYAKAFVLYASEWWRREYQGHWRWDDLLTSLHLDRAIFGNGLVEFSALGFRQWGRTISVSEKGRRSALGTFMKEGGLPISYFNANGGWLERLLQSALSYASQNKDYKNYLKESQQLIPQSAGSEDIIAILIELTEDIYQLVINHHLDEQNDPILYLNHNVPDWYEQLPFPLEAKTAQTLLKKLIQESSALRRTYHKSPKNQSTATHWHETIILSRQLIFDKRQQTLTLSAKLNDFDKLPLFNEENLKTMSDDLSLDFYKNSESSLPLKRLFAYPIFNQTSLKVSNPTTIELSNLSNADWCAGLTLQITDPTGCLLPIVDHQKNRINPYQNASMLDIDASKPFLLSIDKDNDDELIATYVAIGSRTSKEPSALIYVPNDYSYTLSPNGEFLKITQILSGVLYRLTGEVKLSSTHEKDKRYRFKTNSQDANYYYEIKGRRLTDFIYPSLVYKKDFKLYKTNLNNFDDSYAIPDRQIKLKATHSPIYKNLSDHQDLFGIYHLLVLSDDNDVVFETLLGIVPNAFRYDFVPNKNNGKIIFKNCPLKTISLEHNDHIHITQETAGEFVLSAQTLPNKKLTLLLHSSHPTQQCLKLACYFPSSQTIIYDGNGDRIHQSLFGINDTLLGHRIKIFNAGQDRPNQKIEFYLQSEPTIKLQLPLALKANEFVSLEPYRWTNIVTTLISLSKKGLDDLVIVEFQNNNNTGFKLSFSYYEFRIHKENDTLIIKHHNLLSESHNFDNPVLEAIRARHQLTAFNFKSPNHSITTLTNHNNYHSLELLNQLSYTDNEHCDGVWFIMATTDDEQNPSHHIPIRPIAHTPPTQLSPTIPAREREKQLQQALYKDLSQMVANPNDTYWQYLRALSEKIPHLPLIALKQWQYAKTMPEFLAMVAIYGDDLLGKSNYQKYKNEFKDHWQFLNIGEFKKHWEHYPIYLSNHHQEKISDGELLNRVVKEITTAKQNSLSNHSIFELFYQHITENHLVTLKLVQYFLNLEFEKLIVRKQNAHFIENSSLNAILHRLIQAIPNHLRIDPELLVSHPYAKTLALLPIAMAYLSAQTTLDDELLTIRASLIENALAILQLKNFDHQWFEVCFEWAFRYFYQHSQ